MTTVFTLTVNPATKQDYNNIIAYLKINGVGFTSEEPTEDDYDAGQIYIGGVSEDYVNRLTKFANIDYFYE